MENFSVGPPITAGWWCVTGGKSDQGNDEGGAIASPWRVEVFAFGEMVWVS